MHRGDPPCSSDDNDADDGSIHLQADTVARPYAGTVAPATLPPPPPQPAVETAAASVGSVQSDAPCVDLPPHHNAKTTVGSSTHSRGVYIALPSAGQSTMTHAPPLVVPQPLAEPATLWS